MADAIYPEPHLVVGDGEFLHVPGPPAGPAGASTVELPGGELWLVDHVDPAQAVSIEARSDDPLSPLLVAAYGGDRAMFLRDRVREPGSGMDRDQAYLSKLRPGPIRYAPATRAPVDLALARRAGATALLADLVDDTGRHPLSRLAAALSLGVDQRGSPMADVLVGLMGGLPDRGARILELFDTDDLWSLRDQSIRELLELCEVATHIDSRWRSVVGELTENLRGIDEPVAIVAAMAAPPDHPTDRHRVDLLSTHDTDSRAPDTDLEDGRSTVLEWREPGVLSVSVQRGDTGRWVRLFRRDGLVLLGQAPLRRNGLTDATEMLLPADMATEDLVVRVADESEAHGRPIGPAESIRRAVRAGRDAARAQRLDMAVEAAERWLDCARLWRTAGDPVREEQALDLADHSLPIPVLSAPVVDRIEEELGAD